MLGHRTPQLERAASARQGCAYARSARALVIARPPLAKRLRYTLPKSPQTESQPIMKVILSLILATAFCLTSGAQAPADAGAPLNKKQEVLITKEFRVLPEFFGASTPKEKAELLTFFKTR